ncbi:Cytochrome c oxidase subunit 6b-3 (AtCOX6b-3), partial [Durusdinium trenchii]
CWSVLVDEKKKEWDERLTWMWDFARRADRGEGRVQLLRNSKMSDIELKTTPRDPRFPNTNQAQHCWTRYNEWVLCLKKTGSDESACLMQRKFAQQLCPLEKIEQWDTEREEKSFPGLQIDDDE